MLTISSRTPEGDPNQCPICGHRVRLEPSIDTRDAPCPSCGHLLWFPETSKFDSPDRERLMAEGVKVIVTDNEMVPKEMVLKFATKRFGMPSETMRATLNAVQSAKFEKIEWDRLLQAQCWADVLELVGSCYR